MSIVTRVLALIAFTLVLVGGAELINGLHLRRDRIVELRGETVQLARIAELDVVRILDGTHQLLATLAKLPRDRGWDERACAVVEAAASADFEYDHIVAVDRGGTILCSSSGARRLGAAMADPSLLDRIVTTAAFSVGSYGVGQVSGNDVIRVGYPIVDEAGTVIGAIYAGINLTWLNTALEQWKLGESATIDITDRYGMVIARYPDPSSIGQPMSDALKPFLFAHDIGATEAIAAGGVARLYGYVPVNVGISNGLGVFVGREKAQMIAKIDQSIWWNATAVLIVLSLSAVLATIYVRRSLARPFQRLLAVAGHWRDGDWSARTGAASGIPEFDRLAAAFDGMAAEVSARDQSLRQERDFTAALIDSLPGFFLLIDERGRLARWNENLSTLTGIPDGQLAGYDAFEIIAEDDRASARARLADALSHGAADFEGGLIASGGGIRTIQFGGRRLMSDGHPYLVAVGADVTEERQSALRLRTSEERFRAVSEAAQDAIIMADRVGTVVYWNRAAERILGYAAGEAIGRSVHEWFVPHHLQEKAAAGLRDFTATGSGSILGKTVELTAMRKDGIEIPVEISFAKMHLGADLHAVAILRDITERKRSEAEITHMARHDFLTGLANRSVFVEALEAAGASAHRTGAVFAVLYLDLDHFKDINDTLGHPVGDLLLQTVAERLTASARVTDTVARFGGDEFALIATDLRDPADAAVLADTVLAALSEPIAIKDMELRSGASIGIAVFGPDSADAETLLSHADVALYRAKSEGRGTYRFFTEAMDADVRTRVALSAELRAAIAADQLFLVYQPQFDADTARIVGVEALVRWRHPVRGIVAPNDFIPIAERSGLIVALGHWVMHEACRQMREWLDAGIAPPVIAVNLSALQFKTPQELENDIAAILTETGVPPQRVELELTESVLMGASRDHGDTLLRLRKSGLRIAIDDFGIGYSSLDYLRRFPVDRVKIAQQFMLGLADGAGHAIVQAALALARALKIDAIVEGVETAEQLELVKSFGARDVQGYYFSKPLGAGEATALLRKSKVRPVRAAIMREVSTA